MVHTASQFMVGPLRVHSDNMITAVALFRALQPNGESSLAPDLP